MDTWKKSIPRSSRECARTCNGSMPGQFWNSEEASAAGAERGRSRSRLCRISCIIVRISGFTMSGPTPDICGVHDKNVIGGSDTMCLNI